MDFKHIPLPTVYLADGTINNRTIIYRTPPGAEDMEVSCIRYSPAPERDRGIMKRIKIWPFVSEFTDKVPNRSPSRNKLPALPSLSRESNWNRWILSAGNSRSTFILYKSPNYWASLPMELKVRFLQWRFLAEKANSVPLLEDVKCPYTFLHKGTQKIAKMEMPEQTPCPDIENNPRFIAEMMTIPVTDRASVLVICRYFSDFPVRAYRVFSFHEKDLKASLDDLSLVD